jgi:acyl-CoA thioesterase-1
LPSRAAAPVIACLGTSLTAGLGVDPDQAWPARLQERIDRAGLRFRVTNAGVSGETSAGARRRIDWVMKEHPAVLVIETGSNDGLRGQDTAALRENIEAILKRARQQSPPPAIVLVGMEAPPNYGDDYTRRFRAVYRDVAARDHVTLVPFLLEGVAGHPELNQADGIHPTPEGHERIADLMWKTLQPVLAGATL